MLVDALTAQDESPITITKTEKQKNKRRQKIINWSIALLVVGVLVFLNIYFKDLYKNLYYLTKQIMEEKSIKTYLKILAMMFLLQMCFVPGISFFIIYIGYVCKDYWYSVSLIIPATYLLCAMSYFLTRFTIKKYLEKKLSKKWYFKMFYDESREKPWATSCLLRCVLIPVTYKNYLISLMHINFAQFIVPAIFFYFPYFSIYIIIGLIVSNVQDIINNDTSKYDRRTTILFAVVYGLLTLVSMIGMYFLIRMTCQLKKKYKQAEKLNRLIVVENEKQI